MLIYCICKSICKMTKCKCKCKYTQYMVGAPFALLPQFGMAWRYSAEIRWCGSPGFFDSGLQLICIFLVSCFSFSFWQYPIDSLWGSGLVSFLASQAHQHHGHLTNYWCFWHQKAYQQKEAWSAPKFLGKRLQWRWFSKNTMDQHQQMTLYPKSSQTAET